MNNMIKEIILSELVSRSYDSLVQVFKGNTKASIVVSKQELTQALQAHSKYIANLTGNVSFKELRGNRKLDKTYIALDLELQALRYKEKNRKEKKKRIEKIISKTNNHLIILGGPGAGKTTTVKKICQLLLFGEELPHYRFPILINLRDLKKEQTIYTALKDILGIQITLKNEGTQTLSSDRELRIKYVNSYLDSLNAIVILDGLDEVNPDKLRNFGHEIKSLILNLSQSLVIVTCRSASYDLDIDNSVEYELCDLNKKQIKRFVHQWFDNFELSTTFLSEIKKSKFYDFSLKPISLAHLCAIYERTKKFYDKPKSIYKKLVRILIEEWDEQRDIIRESLYSDFDNERKFDFLSHLAFDLTVRYETKVYSEDSLKESFKNINDSFGLPKNQCLKVIREVEAHTGIIIQSSYDTFEFVHKSMQEYLTAEHIIKMPEIPTRLLYHINISNELAITVALSSDPNAYIAKLIFDSFTIDSFSSHFMVEFLSRLAYEKPDFKESVLLPYCFAKIIQDFIHNDGDSLKKVNKILSDFKDIYNLKISFKKFSMYINSSVDNFHDYETEEISEDEQELIAIQKSELLDRFDSPELSEGSDEDQSKMNLNTFVNIEFTDDFFEELDENEIHYKTVIEELKIPSSIYHKHFY